MPRLLLAIALSATAGGGHAASPRGVTIGEAATVRFQVVGEGASEYGEPAIVQARVTVLEARRGASARARLPAVVAPNDAATAGFDYLLVRLRIASEGSAIRIPYEVQPEHFRIFDEAGTPYAMPAMRPPEPALLGQKIYPNEVHDGWLVFLIAEQDRQPELFFFSGQWFQLFSRSAGESGDTVPSARGG
ncbi:MAG: hypothetical protein IT494_04250 [Gammaproteobacteria bacterium]|nr:hypothetical protein [Gammaproteobacteria bacterium]